MAKAKPITGLDVHAPVAKNAEIIARTRLEEMYEWSQYVDNPYEVHNLHNLPNEIQPNLSVSREASMRCSCSQPSRRLFALCMRALWMLGAGRQRPGRPLGVVWVALALFAVEFAVGDVRGDERSRALELERIERALGEHVPAGNLVDQDEQVLGFARLAKGWPAMQHARDAVVHRQDETPDDDGGLRLRVRVPPGHHGRRRDAQGRSDGRLARGARSSLGVRFAHRSVYIVEQGSVIGSTAPTTHSKTRLGISVD